MCFESQLRVSSKQICTIEACLSTSTSLKYSKERAEDLLNLKPHGKEDAQDPTYGHGSQEEAGQDLRLPLLFSPEISRSQTVSALSQLISPLATALPTWVCSNAVCAAASISLRSIVSSESCS